MSFLDNKKYTINSSLGEGNTAVIPWLCIMHNQVTDSVTERFYFEQINTIIRDFYSGINTLLISIK
ncbi:hypothetical protein EU92_0206 [Prochlorococcus marinus str. MIT 9107]|uniref:Type IV methyl-directed restriction enzyme EcoKMcrB subunit DNA-binding domain-containing protein n=1 Tax=Prochlorococcus marinus str. MIT 9116 TaxID=167544 RepID=A0A0A1ZZJ7_PROMR|nr:hypothetical protein EU92_0206 [Prochlorococcus marinus str. MIT 9107]KGF93538.1 hypothetical protein EU93_0167 [Prochlorococcus marinus str. MIT 9116]KGF94049.1 hypothetical protein EU94_0955 [Prochlorococcus marinus str. MIT 9123]